MPDREILFRGKRLDNWEWIYGYYCCIGPAGKEKHYIIPTYASAFYGIEVDPSTVSRSTGLTDKNGTRIFEGDLCRVTRPCILAYGKIAFSDGCFWFVDDGPGGMIRLGDIKPNGFEIKVIGNRWDNPELMGGEQLE